MSSSVTAFLRCTDVICGSVIRALGMQALIDDDVPVTWDNEVLDADNSLLFRVAGGVVDRDRCSGAQFESAGLVRIRHPNVDFVHGPHFRAGQLLNDAVG